jgi:hypothetical protein
MKSRNEVAILVPTGPIFVGERARSDPEESGREPVLLTVAELMRDLLLSEPPQI